MPLVAVWPQQPEADKLPLRSAVWQHLSPYVVVPLTQKEANWNWVLR